jgi:antibiotic biosynthesis monooxygenase (ABM) superfamily enzyme
VKNLYSLNQLKMNAKARLLMSLKIWLVIYPSITLFLFLFGQQLTALPLYQRTFILTISLVPWMMFIGVPANSVRQNDNSLAIAWQFKK